MERRAALRAAEPFGIAVVAIIGKILTRFHFHCGDPSPSSRLRMTHQMNAVRRGAAACMERRAALRAAEPFGIAVVAIIGKISTKFHSHCGGSFAVFAAQDDTSAPTTDNARRQSRL